MDCRDLQIAQVQFDVVAEAIGDGSLFLRSRFQDAIGSDARDKVGAQVGEKFRKLPVTQHLYGAHNRRSVDFITLGQFARGEVVSVLRFLQISFATASGGWDSSLIGRWRSAFRVRSADRKCLRDRMLEPKSVGTDSRCPAQRVRR